jgi:hypothetical protein
MNTMTINAPALTGENLLANSGTVVLQSRLKGGRSACMRLLLSLAMVLPGVAFAVGTFSLFRLSGTDAPLAALAGSVILIYLGTAFLSASLILAAIDIGAGVAALWLASATGDPRLIAAAFVVHALWGTLRSAIGADNAPHLVSNWTAFSSAMALLLLIG